MSKPETTQADEQGAEIIRLAMDNRVLRGEIERLRRALRGINACIDADEMVSLAQETLTL